MFDEERLWTVSPKCDAPHLKILIRHVLTCPTFLPSDNCSVWFSIKGSLQAKVELDIYISFLLFLKQIRNLKSKVGLTRPC